MPVRAAPLLAATLNDTDPLPDPLAAPAKVIQLTFADAVHAQLPADAVTATLPAPPPAGTDWLVGEIEKVQGGGGGGGGGAASCDTVNV